MEPTRDFVIINGQKKYKCACCEGQYELASIVVPDLCALRAQFTNQIRAHPERSDISQSELELPLRLICSPPLTPTA